MAAIHTLYLSLTLALANAHAARAILGQQPPCTTRIAASPFRSSSVICCSFSSQSSEADSGIERRVAIVVDQRQSQSELVAAVIGGRRKQRQITRTISYDRLLNNMRMDPVPLMVGAAMVAAAGPATLRSLRALPQQLASPWRRIRRKRLPSGEAAAAAAAARPDGALEDPRQLSLARRLLDAWRGGDAEYAELAGSDARESALGLAMLEFATKHSDNATMLRELTGHLRQQATLGDPTIATGALRKACTAASRQTLGKGRDGSVATLAAAVKEERCGALLLLSHAFGSDVDEATTLSAEQLAENAVAAAAVRQRICLAFGLDGLEERAEAARRRVASRLLRLETRRALRRIASMRSSAGALPTLSASLAGLAPLLGLGLFEFTASLMQEAKEPMRADLEAALREWVAQRPTEAYLACAKATRLAVAIAELGESGAMAEAAAGNGQEADAAAAGGVRGVGLTSTARHAMYGGFVRAAMLEEVEKMAMTADGRYSTFSSPLAFGVRDAVVLRQLLSVLPASVYNADKNALESCGRVGRALGVPRAQLEKLGSRLRMEPAKVREVLDAVSME